MMRLLFVILTFLFIGTNTLAEGFNWLSKVKFRDSKSCIVTSSKMDNHGSSIDLCRLHSEKYASWTVDKIETVTNSFLPFVV